MEADAANEAEGKWLSGNYAGALDLLSAQAPSPQRMLLTAQIYLRIGAPARALETLRGRPGVGDLQTDGQRAKAAAFEAAALATQNDANAARSALARARAACVEDAATAAEIDYQDAYVSWMLGDSQRARELIERYTAGGELELEAAIKARFFMLRGWLFAADEQYYDQASSMMQAIRVLKSMRSPDVGLLAWAVFALAALLRDIYVPAAWDVVLDVDAQLPWTDDLAMPHFQTVRAIGWSFALEGDYIPAFRKFNAAKLLAPGAPASILVHLDHAECATFSNQDILAAAERAEADDLIRTIDWSSARWEEARALIQAAEVFAPDNADRAAELLETARTLEPTMARNAGYAHDRRLHAHADYADALIRLARSDRRVARHRALRAYHVFEQIGYRWRAARCALLLHRLRERGDWLAQAEALIAPYQRSFVAREIAAFHSGRNPLTDLTARQREILDLLRAGKTIDQIAEDLNISPNTVRVHITIIHRVFGVQRRAQLLREVSRWIKAA